MCLHIVHARYARNHRRRAEYRRCHTFAVDNVSFRAEVGTWTTDRDRYY